MSHIAKLIQPKRAADVPVPAKNPHADAFKLMQHYNVLMVVNKTWVNKRRAHSWEGSRQKTVPNPVESLLVRQTIFPLGGSANVAMPLIIW